MAYNPYAAFDGSSAFASTQRQSTAPRYGQRIGAPPGSMFTMDFRDSDGDKIDDRYQAGPGQPSQGPKENSGFRETSNPYSSFDGSKGLIDRLRTESGSGTPDMSAYSPAGLTIAPKQPAPRPTSRPSVGSREQADQYIREMRGVDPGTYTDDQIRLLNEAYRNSRISHAPSYYRNDMGQVVRRQSGQAGTSETAYGQPRMQVADQFQPGFFSRSQNFDGSFTEQPNYALRDAFANSINEAMFPYYANSGTYLGQGAPPPTWGQAPSFDFNQMLTKSRDMVSDGWTNPFLGQMAQSPLAGLFGS